MTLFARLVVGSLLLAHGMVHLLHIVPAAADPKYPFSLARSWLLPESTRRPLALVLITAVVLGFLACALALWGVPGLTGAWSGITIVAATLSLALLIAFWDRQLWIGVLIDVPLVAAALVRPSWVDALLPWKSGAAAFAKRAEPEQQPMRHSPKGALARARPASYRRLIGLSVGAGAVAAAIYAAIGGARGRAALGLCRGSVGLEPLVEEVEHSVDGDLLAVSGQGCVSPAFELDLDEAVTELVGEGVEPGACGGVPRRVVHPATKKAVRALFRTNALLARSDVAGRYTPLTQGSTCCQPFGPSAGG